MPPNHFFGATPGPISPGADQRLKELVSAKSGLMYEDANIQIGVKNDVVKVLGRTAIYIKNKSRSMLTHIQEKIYSESMSGQISFTVKQPVPDTLATAAQGI